MSDAPPFIARKAELAHVVDAMSEAFNRRGGVVLIEGPMGVGKSRLLEELMRRVSDDPRLRGTRVATGYCYQEGSESPYRSFVEALSELATHGRKRSVSKLTFDLIRQVGPDLLRVIPVLGDAAAAGVKAVSVARDWWLAPPPDDELGMARNIPLQFTDTLLALSEAEGPVLLAIEDMHWADAASSQLLLRLSHRAGEAPILVVVTYRKEDDPRSPFANVRRELVSSGRATVIALDTFTENDIWDYLVERYGPRIAHQLTLWLFALSGGQPLFVTNYLSLLERRGTLAQESPSGTWHLREDISDLPVPEGVGAIIEGRLARVTPQERRALQYSAVQGQRFRVVITALLMDVDELEMLDLLQRLAEREEFIELTRGDQWTDEWTDTFTFSDQVLQKVLYDGLTPRQRALFHQKVGQALEERLAGVVAPPIQAWIEVANNLEAAHDWMRVPKPLLDAAEASYEAAALKDTRLLCRRALLALANVPESRLDLAMRGVRAHSTQLLLMSSELQWEGTAHDAPDGPSAMDLLDQADRDADLLQDAPLRAHLTFLRARVMVIRESLPAALTLFEKAAQQARDAGDRLGEVVALTELGHHGVGLSLEKGLATLLSAHALWERLEQDLEVSVPGPILARHLHQLQGKIGVAFFDRGDFDTAERWLRAALDGLRLRKMPDIYSMLSNFLAQLYTAEGRFEEAERILQETLEILRSEEGAVAHRGYNLALLGKVYLEWGRIDDARSAGERAYEVTRGMANAAVLPLIRNYFCDLLTDPRNTLADHALARSLLAETAAEAEASGFTRSVVAAHMLLSRTYLAEGSLGKAVDHSRVAYETLEEHGFLPALRSEEVLHTHAQALRASGAAAEAAVVAGRAAAIVDDKALTIQDESQRYQFLHRVPLNREILAAHDAPV